MSGVVNFWQLLTFQSLYTNFLTFAVAHLFSAFDCELPTFQSLHIRFIPFFRHCILYKSLCSLTYRTLDSYHNLQIIALFKSFWVYRLQECFTSGNYLHLVLFVKCFCNRLACFLHIPHICCGRVLYRYRLAIISGLAHTLQSCHDFVSHVLFVRRLFRNLSKTDFMPYSRFW